MTQQTQTNGRWHTNVVFAAALLPSLAGRSPALVGGFGAIGIRQSEFQVEGKN